MEYKMEYKIKKVTEYNREIAMSKVGNDRIAWTFYTIHGNPRKTGWVRYAQNTAQLFTTKRAAQRFHDLLEDRAND